MRVQGVRLAAVAALALPLVPLQALALRLNWRLAGRLPVFFHRCVLRIIGVSVKTLGREDNRRPFKEPPDVDDHLP